MTVAVASGYHAPMAKTALALRIDPDLLHGLDALQKKLEHKPSRTTLIEDAIRALLERHGLPKERKRVHGR